MSEENLTSEEERWEDVRLGNLMIIGSGAFIIAYILTVIIYIDSRVFGGIAWILLILAIAAEVVLVVRMLILRRRQIKGPWPSFLRPCPNFLNCGNALENIMSLNRRCSPNLNSGGYDVLASGE